MTAPRAAPGADPGAGGVRPGSYVPWVDAWRDALYGEGGFYLRPEGPAGHFRTAGHAAPAELAAAIAELARRAGAEAVLDVGAGRGELLAALRPHGLRLHGADVVPRPAGLPAGVGWSRGLEELPADAFAGALVVAWELLDVVPCPVLELDEDGVPRVVLVQPATGRERLGPPAGAGDLAWCDRWWPRDGLEEGDRLEVGAPRDALWAGLAARAAGARLLLAVDYAHTRDARPPHGSLTGFARGRAIPPRPDGASDVTAHVALDAAAAATGLPTLLTRQDAALRALGARHRELLDPGALGGFGWLLQAPAGDLPDLSG